MFENCKNSRDLYEVIIEILDNKDNLKQFLLEAEGWPAMRIMANQKGLSRLEKKSLNQETAKKLYIEARKKALEVGNQKLPDVEPDPFMGLLSIAEWCGVQDEEATYTPEGEWSEEMSKSVMMTKLGLDGYYKFNKFASRHDIKKIRGNRQLFRIRLDKMHPRDREKLEKK